MLDVMMPGLDGLGVLQNLRAAGSQVPVIFLTARDTASDRIGGLRAGADDYVVKPFSVEELLARVHAVLRRSAPEEARDGVLRVADLELDENSHEVTRAGVEVHLTATEFELLRYLMRNERVVLSKAQILDRVWKYDFQGQSNIVELYIGYLRKKVDAVEPKLIHTVRGAGYVIKAPAPASDLGRQCAAAASRRGTPGRPRWRLPCPRSLDRVAAGTRRWSAAGRRCSSAAPAAAPTTRCARFLYTRLDQQLQATAGSNVRDPAVCLAATADGPGECPRRPDGLGRRARHRSGSPLDDPVERRRSSRWLSAPTTVPGCTLAHAGPPRCPTTDGAVPATSPRRGSRHALGVHVPASS